MVRGKPSPSNRSYDRPQPLDRWDQVSATRRTILSWSAANGRTTLAGALEGSTIRASSSVCTLVLTRDASPVPPARSSVEHRGIGFVAVRGRFVAGNVRMRPQRQLHAAHARPEMQVRGGTATWYTASPSPTNDHTIGLNLSIDGTSAREAPNHPVLDQHKRWHGAAVGNVRWQHYPGSNEALHAMVLARVVRRLPDPITYPIVVMYPGQQRPPAALCIAASGHRYKELVEQGNASLRQGCHEQALQHYEKALVLASDHPGIPNNYAAVLERLDRLDEAFRVYAS